MTAPSTKSSAPKAGLTDLPPDVLPGLLGCLRPQAFALVASTCKHLHNLCKEPHSWAGEGCHLSKLVYKEQTTLLISVC